MKKENAIRDKSYQFALEIIRFYKLLIEKKEFVLSKQILRSGTSVGANIEEAMEAQSKREFISKLYTSLKEAQETIYWLRLLRDSNIVTKEEMTHLMEKGTEIARILTAIIKSSKESLAQ